MREEPQPIWRHTRGDYSAEVVQFSGGRFVLYVWDGRDRSAKPMRREFTNREDAVIAGVKMTKEQA